MSDRKPIPEKFRSNFHVHTYISPCCGDHEGCRPENLLRIAEGYGLHELGFCDHVFIPRPGMKESYGASEQEFLFVRNQVRMLEYSATRPLLGWEVDVFGKNSYSLHEKYLEYLDYATLSCHFYPEEQERVAFQSHDTAAARILNRYMIAATTGFADIIAHPFYLHKQWFPDANAIHERISQKNLEEFMCAARENGIALEFSPVLFRADYWNVQNAYRIYDTARSMGVKLAPGSDAHTAGAVANHLTTAFVLEDLRLDDSNFVCYDELKHAGRRAI
ncbi:MAG TPA: PHP domain-containing protein [Candidatus Brocadiia bacterium]|nr:PHP domain-containing protein [Candidatus Brocadiia bacterium]